jgi:hypothetical protein
MTEENILKLFSKHPTIFVRQVSPQCSDGWFDLIDTACHLIEHRLTNYPEVSFNLLQIKEKFGTMSFYYSGGDEYIRGVVHHAMAMSAAICEITGNVGSLHITKNGWIRTVSDEIAKDREMTPHVWDQ